MTGPIYDPVEPKFQSLIHQGFLCICSFWTYRGISPKKSFNPLFIRGFFVSWETPMIPGKAVMVSIPYSSGVSLYNLYILPLLTRRGGAFQSLIHQGFLCIGGPAGANSPETKKFQSLIHQGFLCMSKTLG